MTVLKSNDGIESLRDECLDLESTGRLPRMNYKTCQPEYPVVMSDGCAIKERLDADFAALFLNGTHGESVALDDPCFRPPQPAPQCNPSQIPCCGAGSFSEDAPCTAA